ncbi:coiled-coil domain-containing protein 157 isoform X2 [Microcaecilia unicolor]|uniref:Coiled-coil domain-containing protein 157 isoform X2 n=1 Tax=Microcaecilia unicolor TaxID=1415580 RepID=A0A6P7ZFF8_9AMPH|nr:coiled-coil domain-containing protein 157 isoform X2 [Microcaecilia unicolor]
MAHLLGNRNCIDSLRKDITDLQGAIVDVFSRVGAVRYPSWKFPDKISCDLDLVALLENYDHVEDDPEFSQHSHVLLLELVIDRLLLLLQSFTGYMEILTSKHGIPASRLMGPSMSIGLTVRKYWNSLMKLGSLYQKVSSEKKFNKDDSPTHQPALTMIDGKERIKSSTSQASLSNNCLIRSSQSQHSDQQTTSVSNSRSQCSYYTVSVDTRTVGCQTVESALVPCDSCATAQASLREVSNAIIKACQNQGLPSSLCKFQEVVQEMLGNRILTATEMSYWASEQSKDISRINKQLVELMQLVNPLKAELEASEVEKVKLKSQIEDFIKDIQKEKDEQGRQQMLSKHCLEEIKLENLENMTRWEKAKKELQTRAADLEENVSTLKKELTLQHNAIQDLELTKEKLLDQMRTEMADKCEVVALEDQVRLLTSQLESKNRDLHCSSLALDKERARIENMLRHEASLQAKQKALLQQLDSLDQECEELRISVSDAEEDKTRLEKEIKEIEQQRQQVQAKLHEQQALTKQLQQEKDSLEQATAELCKNISELEVVIQEQKKRETLLVTFPELNIPSEVYFESSGNLAEDMEKQMQANSIRIGILEDENARLRTSLSKLRDSAQQGALKLIPQTQLWPCSGTSSETSQDTEIPRDGARVDSSVGVVVELERKKGR